ncbi:MAG: sulfatase-like hydrolase/transferase [Altererythrobacter sp.]|nr:sulfatase-like hydrolase/transferase [Altererythrobacter sp.]OJU59536.1 MAG: twin-arginine translocation pathway signal protein [Altererythrobacter sp. 66-12]
MTDSIKGPRLTRRTALAGALGAAAVATVARPTLAQAPGRKPNVLYIMADDLGYADLSCYGRREYETPVLDRLATQGMMFLHAYANSAVCTATRVALITGRYQYRLPVGLQEPLGAQDVGLPGANEHPTIASLMRDAGYRTSLIGKWHMGSLPKYGPLQSGYDEFWGLRGGGVDYYRHGFNGNVDLWDGDTKVEEAGYMTDLIADRTITTLERRAADKRPFFISLHFTAPHWPWEGDDEEGKAESDRIAASSNPAAFMHYDGGTMETYATMMRSLDSNIGRVLARLGELGLENDTIVVFTSDNGGERFSDTWPFTGKKTELLEGGLRIPAIVRWPGVIAPGGTSDVPIMSMDWLPTFVAAGGGKLDPAYLPDGVDIRPALLGRTLPDRSLFWRFKNRNQKAARRGSYKYLSINGNEFLFDVVNDPLERGNLKDRMPDRFAELKAAFDAWDATMLHDPKAPSFGISPTQQADHFAPDPGT